MNCNKMMDKFYEYSGGESLPLLLQLRISLHLFFCPGCTQEVERFEAVRDMLHSDFFPPSPDFEDTIMALIAGENSDARSSSALEEGEWLEAPDTPGGLSTRGWVIAGIIILFSLASAFIGLDFNEIALAAGMSYLLPVGIITGIVLTSYGALFIGSHLKELSERFGL
jgi:hypothetical protein